VSDREEDLPMRARSVFQLRVIDPTTPQRIEGEVLGFLVSLAVNSPTESLTKVTLEIVDLRTGVVVSTMREHYQTARDFGAAIEVDLDRLDPSAFAKEWGFAENAEP
jgi:hypothetical protein